jgi:hypothetical protein
MQNDYQSVIGSIEDLLARPNVQRASTHLLDPLQRERIAQSLVKMRRKIAYVATIGSQGAGKSTLLNALLFNRRLLPEGEGVTTSLVCEIHPLDETEPAINVRFKSGESLAFPLGGTVLREYLDEGLNPKNDKGVATVRCYVDSDLIPPGTCFVDTPGLGSLMTWQNDETMAFVREMSLGIYVLRGTPPMTSSEAEHLYNIWKFSPEFIFVQNVWGESSASVQEGLRENEKAISAVALRHNDPRPITIIALNIHAAAEAAHNPQNVGQPNTDLNGLRALVRSRIGRVGQESEIKMQARQITLYLGQGVENGRKRVEASSLESKEELSALVESLHEVDGQIQSAEKKLADHEKDFRRRCRDVIASSQRELRDGLRAIKHLYTQQVNSDGGSPGIEDTFASDVQTTITRINQAFGSQIKEAESDFIRASAAEMRTIESAIWLPGDASLETPEDVSGTRIAEWVGGAIGGAGKFTSIALVGAATTAFASSVIAGSSAVAALSAAAVVVPGVGWAIAGSLLVLGAIVKVASKGRRREALRKYFATIEESVVRDGSKELSYVGAARADDLAELVRGHVKGAVAQQAKTANDLKAQMSSSKQNRELASEQLREMLRDLAETILHIETVAGIREL